MSTEAERLTIADAESAYKAILQLVINYTGYPTNFTPSNANVRWNMLSDSTSIALYPLNGAIYLRKYISGSYVAQLPFQIAYKVTATTNKAMISAQDLISDIGKWLEKAYIDFEDENVALESIERTTPGFVISQDEKNIVLGINLQLTYSYKK